MFYIQAETLDRERTRYGCTLKSIKPVEEYVKDGLPTDLFYDLSNAIRIYRGYRDIVTTEAMERYNEVLNILGVKDEDFGYHTGYISDGVDYAFKDALDVIFKYDNELIDSFKEIITEDLGSNDKLELNGYVHLACAYNNHVHKLAKTTSYGKLIEQTLLINVETKTSSDSDDDQIAKTDKEFDEALASSTPESAPLEGTPVVPHEIKEELVADPIGETPANESEMGDEIQEQSEEESEPSETKRELYAILTEVASSITENTDDMTNIEAARMLSNLWDKMERGLEIINTDDSIEPHTKDVFGQVNTILHATCGRLVTSMDESMDCITKTLNDGKVEDARADYDECIKPYINMSFVSAETRAVYAKLGERIMDAVINKVEKTKDARRNAYNERKSRSHKRNRKRK